jgi:tetratricopeptide (TPR) repeat protein
MPGWGVPVTTGRLAELGAATGAAILADCSVSSAAVAALGLRDQALAALDGGDPRAALVMASDALAALAAAGLTEGPDEGAVLVARAEIQKALDPFDAAAAAITAATSHPDVAGDLSALGALYHLAGRCADAGHAYQRALTVFEHSYGPDHFEVATTCANLAVLHAGQGHSPDAEAAGRRALHTLETLLGPGDAEVGLTLRNLAAGLPAGHRHLTAARDALARLKEPS